MTQQAPSFNPFAGARSANTSQQGNYFSPGRYKVKIKNCVYRPTQNSGDVFLVETQILETSDPIKHPIGADRTWIQGTKNKNVYLSAVKAFAAAAVGLDLKNPEHQAVFDAKVVPQVEETLLAAITKNALGGRILWVDVTEKEKKTKPGENFNLHTFGPGEAPLPGLL
jgi:hypothetical protein